MPRRPASRGHAPSLPPRLPARWGRALLALGARGAGVLRRAAVALLARLVRLLPVRRRPVPVEVCIAERARRRVLERELRGALRRLQRALGASLPPGLAVVVQQVIVTDRQLAGCCQVGRRRDGTAFALVRLALQANGRRHSTDELLAALAEQVIGLALQDGGASVLVPVELEPEGLRAGPPPATSRAPDRLTDARRATTMRPDPLAPRGAGAAVALDGSAA